MSGRFLSRKFVLALFALISLDVMLWFECMEASLYVTAFIATITSYMTANVVQKTTTKGTP